MISLTSTPHLKKLGATLAMALKDDQAFMFTHTPSKIVRIWTPVTPNASTPLISCTLEVKFSTTPSTDVLFGSTTMPTSEGAIEDWKCARRTWDALERGVCHVLTDSSITLTEALPKDVTFKLDHQTAFDLNENIQTLISPTQSNSRKSEQAEKTVSKRSGRKH